MTIRPVVQASQRFFAIRRSSESGYALRAGGSALPWHAAGTGGAKRVFAGRPSFGNHCGPCAGAGGWGSRAASGPRCHTFALETRLAKCRQGATGALLVVGQPLMDETGRRSKPHFRQARACQRDKLCPSAPAG